MRAFRLHRAIISTGLILASIVSGQTNKIEHMPFPPLKGAYKKVTNNFRDYTNFNVETVRGMDFSSDGNLYAINTHGSRLVRHVDVTADPEASWPTLNNPVSMDVWGDRVVVLGGATHSLAIHDRFTGEVLGHHELPSEPGDLIMDETTGIAYISSQAENLVIALDLNNTNNIVELERHEIPGEQPRFMYLDTHPISLERVLVVAPMLSGNNTAPLPGAIGVEFTREQATGEIVNVSGFANGGLPDEDLLVLPLVGGASPPVLPSGREAGTLMLEHARNPLTNEYWALTVDLHNDLPGQRGEDELRGIFASNNLAIFAPSALGVPRDLPDRIIDLDDNDPSTAGAQYSSETSVSFPYALAFVPPTNDALAGWAGIASSTGDLVALLDPFGNRVANISLPRGSIPRDLAVDPETGTLLAVYCWGTNKILVYSLNDLLLTPLPLNLGVDPTPQDVKNGRRIFYDAHPSLNGRSTCASCHAAGAADGLAWKLSDLDDDPKDIMVTQSLIGIQDTPAYHWREERFLPDFNGAFPGLLGHAAPLDESPGGDLDDFVEFVFSLQPHANHNQHKKRILDDSQTAQIFRNGLSGSAVRGQDHFIDLPSDGPFSCADCHSLPNGAQGLSVPDSVPDIARARNVGVAHLRQMNHKDQDIVFLSDPALPNSLPVPRGGYGFLHSGNILDLFDFANAFVVLTEQQRTDIAAFMHQFDQGTAPAAHTSVHLTSVGTQASENRIRNLLFQQVKRGWIDVVVSGTTTIQGQSRELRWLYFPGVGGSEGFFESNVAGLPQLTLAQFSGSASLGNANNLFLGVPMGDGRRWAFDPDGDGLRDEEELLLGTDPDDIDSDGDSFPDGYEVAHGANPLLPNTTVPDTNDPIVIFGYPRLDHVGATYAKFFIETDEPVTLDVDTAVAGGPSHKTEVFAPAKRHTVVVQGLDPSSTDGVTNTYTADIRAIDLSGNDTTVQLAFTMLESCTNIEAVEINDLQWASTVPSGNMLDATAEVLVEFERDAPFQAAAPGQVVVLQVMHRLMPDQPWQISPNVTSLQLVQDFDIRTIEPDQTITIAEYNALPGPFLLSPATDDSGRAQVSFSFGGVPVQPDDQLELRLSVQAVLTPSPEHTSLDPVFERFSISSWKMPSTAKSFRGIEFQL
ncbi:MAG: hypothetical protein CMJ89_08535 [Planctomycetes bacterium]|jgi:hypothetical protein|nr:hypothetical protein [Planctomycetota bacterium]